MNANLPQQLFKQPAKQSEPAGSDDRAHPSLHRMSDIIRTHPFAAQEMSAGDTLVDNLEVAIWRNQLLECSFTQPLADHTIALQLAGQRVKRVDKQKLGGIPGRFAILPAQSSSAWQSDGESQFAHLYFTPEFLSDLALTAFDADPERFELIEGELIQDHQLQRLMNGAIALFSQPDRPLPLETNSLAQVLGIHLIRRYSNLFAAPDSFDREKLNAAQLQQVMEYIDENLGRSLTVQGLADVLHLSQYHFLRAFRNTLNQTPRRYVLQRRVTKAKDLIRQGELSLADIAYQLGFSSQSHLSTAFKQLTGVTPSQFQRSAS
jgi:AraC family transcriptional regulator